jgi:ADP-heptose:LPS heptosyltransferase
MLELGWENEPRVVCLSGEINIRQTLALARECDAVIGGETGVLNAVAFEPDVRKVVLLSHSSRENLTKHWLNAAAIEPVSTACYPCHRLHYDRRFCPEDPDTGASVCQRSIHPDTVFNALEPQ